MPDLVMVVEDEKEIRDLVRYNLERAGFRVATAADGEQALEEIFASRPDALVLDLMLPGRNGLEVLRELRGEARRASCRCSAHRARRRDGQAARLRSRRRRLSDEAVQSARAGRAAAGAAAPLAPGSSRPCSNRADCASTRRRARPRSRVAR
jgi:CheY-like chemotaxis protein